MNRKQLTFLIVVGAVLGGLAWVVWQKKQAPYRESTAKMGGKVLPNFPLNDVEQILIKQAKAELHLLKKNDRWVVSERGDYPAKFSSISDMLRKFWDLKITKPVSVAPPRLPMLELVAPDKGAGTLVEFKDKGGKVINTVLLGAKSMKESAGNSPFGGGSFPDGRYLMVGSDIQTVALVTEPFMDAEATPEQWLEKEGWFKVEKLKSISVTGATATNNWKLTRETEAGEWKLADAKPGESLDTAKSGGVSTALSTPSFVDVATNSSPEATGLSKPLVARLETFDGFSYAARLGSKSGEENYFFQIEVAGSFPKERTPGKDEKAEDKEKLDKEFKENRAKQEEKLKAEKAFEKWTYVVSKWTVDPLLKERKDLLAEKKDEAKKDENTAAFPASFPPPSPTVVPSLPPPPPPTKAK